MDSLNLPFLEKYLQKRSLYPPLINKKPNQDLGIIVVIPCYHEPDILKTLESIENCYTPKKEVEVIIVINSSEKTDNEIIAFNKKTKKEIENWVLKTGKKQYMYHYLLLENLPKKKAGAGYARKVGMDEAVYRFFQANVGNGIICSLDADTLVAPNYLVEIENLFNSGINCNGCSIYFEHAIEGEQYSQEIYRRVAEYELHIRYYKQALKFTDFPYYHYTVGSSFAVSAKAYSVQGGMNKKQAGEDFYFLQKIMPMGNYYELNSTTVYPSSRPSDRVPFGTGPIINQYLNSPEKDFLTYNFETFAPLKQLFADNELFFKAGNHKIEEISYNYHPAMKEFLIESDYIGEIQTINNNTAQLKNFTKRFFHWFDGFKIIKYLNFAHENYFKKQSIDIAVNNLSKEIKTADLKQFSTKEKLIHLRNLEKR